MRYRHMETEKTMLCGNIFFPLKFEGKSVREIAEITGVSTGTVSRELKDYDEPQETDQMTIDMM